MTVTREMFIDPLDAAEVIYYCDMFEPVAPWRVDDAALQRAVDRLGLKWPVEVLTGPKADEAITLMFGYGAACYSRVNAIGVIFEGAKVVDEDRHYVYIHSYKAPTFASISLWHELTHASQAERGKLARSPERALGELSNGGIRAYAAVPDEYEAYASAVNHFDIEPLAVPA